MSKKNLIILVTLLIILFGGAIAYLFLSIKPSTIVDTDTVDQDSGNPFPFGTGTSNGTGGGTGRPGTSFTSTTTPSTQTRPVLRHLSLVPVAGAGLYDSGTSTQVRYIERGTGHIYQSRVENTEPTKLSNTPIIKIYDAFWTDKNTAVIIQKLKDDSQTIDSFLVTMSNPSVLQSGSSSVSSSLSSKITSSFLGSNMQSLALSPKKNRVTYLTPNEAGGVVGIVSQTDGSKKVQVFDSALKNWNLSWPTENILTFTTKPSSSAPGFLYFVSTVTNTMTKILGGINGLTTLTNTDANKVLFGTSLGGGLTLSVYDIKNAVKQDLSLITLPEKCVWSKKEKEVVYCGVPLSIPSDKYPDAWYQGKVSFSDELWKINTGTGELRIVADIKELSGQDIDMTNLALNDKETLLVFINKQDLTLWSLELR
ncbi:hypothetical protein EPO17_01935 [Patescibacteria group bacterium]|nr:MAG: hypothetical protein EPO17_01935 [Patescibacteria group bacterium]